LRSSFAVPDLGSNLPFRITVASAYAAGCVVVLSFWIFHTIWILNIPWVVAEGLIVALPAAAALAWAVRATREAWGRVGGGVSHGVLLGLLIWTLFVPHQVGGMIWGPWEQPASFSEAIPMLHLAFFGAPLGAAVGWAWTRQARPAVAWSVAATALTAYLGGAIAGFGGRGTMLGLFFWLLPTFVLAGVAFVATEAVFSRRG